MRSSASVESVFGERQREQEAKRGKDILARSKVREEEQKVHNEGREVCKEKDFVKLSLLVSAEIGLVVVVVGGAVQWGRWQGCHGSVPDGQAVSSQGVRGDVGLSGSLAGRDTTPCDWGGARVSERGQEWWGWRQRRGEVEACLMR